MKHLVKHLPEAQKEKSSASGGPSQFFFLKKKKIFFNILLHTNLMQSAVL